MSVTQVILQDKDFFEACLNPDFKKKLFEKHKLIKEIPTREKWKDEFLAKNGLEPIKYTEYDITPDQFWYDFSDKCRFCKGQLTKDTITKVSSYWSVLVCACHKECKVKGMSEEAYDCQMIDADCNYCKWFIRGKGGMTGGAGKGHCWIDWTETTCQSNSFSGKSCFEHRKPFK